jgi:hypothetical protein
MSFVQSAVTIEGRSQFTVSAAGQSNPLDAGVYDVWATADAYIKVAPTANNVTSATGYLVPGGNGIVTVRIAKDGLRIGSTAAISVHRVE